MAKSVGDAEIFLDSITFVKGSVTYDFSSADDAVDYGIVSVVNGAVGLRIDSIESEGTEDGYYVMCGCSTSTGSGLKFSFGGIDLSNYKSIIVRAKVTYQFYIAVNGVDITAMGNHVNSGSYSEVDLLALINTYNAGKSASEKITKLDSFTFHRNYNKTNIYVDTITFIEGVAEVKPQNIATLDGYAAYSNISNFSFNAMPEELKAGSLLGGDAAKWTFNAQWANVTFKLTETVSIGAKVYVSIYTDSAIEIGFKFAQDSNSDWVASSSNKTLVAGWNLVEIDTSNLSEMVSGKTAINYIHLQNRTGHAVVYLESVYVK